MKFLLVLFLFVGAAGFFVFNLSLGVFDDLFFVDKAEELFQEVVERQVVADFFVQEPEREISIPPPLRILNEIFVDQDEVAPSVFLESSYFSIKATTFLPSSGVLQKGTMGVTFSKPISSLTLFTAKHSSPRSKQKYILPPYLLHSSVHSKHSHSFLRTRANQYDQIQLNVS